MLWCGFFPQYEVFQTMKRKLEAHRLCRHNVQVQPYTSLPLSFSRDMRMWSLRLSQPLLLYVKCFLLYIFSCISPSLLLSPSIPREAPLRFPSKSFHFPPPSHYICCHFLMLLFPFLSSHMYSVHTPCPPTCCSTVHYVFLHWLQNLPLNFHPCISPLISPPASPGQLWWSGSICYSWTMIYDGWFEVVAEGGGFLGKNNSGSCIFSTKEAN